MLNPNTKDESKYIKSLNRLGNKIPAERKTLESHDLRWFLRNGAIFLRDVPDSEYTLDLAKKILSSRE